MTSRLFLAVLWVCASSVASPTVSAGDTRPGEPAPANNRKVSFSPSLNPSAPIATLGGGPETLVFTSPPRENAARGQEIYAPVAAYLSSAIGKKVVYRHPGTWGAYRSQMLRGDYDIIFDGPHFIGYRAEKMHYQALAKLPGPQDFAIVTRADEKFESVAQMGGRTFCAHAPPNLGTLLLLAQFDNPSRQPAIVPVEGWDNIFAGIVAGRCVGAVLPSAILRKLDKSAQLKIVFQTESLPNQGFSAGPRVTPAQQAKLTAALTAPEATAALARLRAAFKVTEPLTAANNSEYAGLGRFLRNEFGYY